MSQRAGLLITIDSGGAVSNVERLDRSLDRLERSGRKAKKSQDSLGGSIASAAATVVASIAGYVAFREALEALVITPIKLAASFETAELQLTQFLGSPMAAKAALAELAKFAEETPFELPGLINMELQLLAAGGTALATMEHLRLVGDAAAATGAPIENLTMWFTRAYSAIQAGNPLGEVQMELTQLRVAMPEVTAELEEMRAAGASNEEIWAKFLTQFSRTSGAMEKLSQTFEGRASTMRDAWSSFQRTIGQAGPMDAAKAGINAVIGGLDGFNQSGAVAEMIGKAITDGMFNIAEAALSAYDILLFFGELAYGLSVPLEQAFITTEGVAWEFSASMHEIAMQIAGGFFDMSTSTTNRLWAMAAGFMEVSADIYSYWLKIAQGSAYLQGHMELAVEYEEEIDALQKRTGQSVTGLYARQEALAAEHNQKVGDLHQQAVDAKEVATAKQLELAEQIEQKEREKAEYEAWVLSEAITNEERRNALLDAKRKVLESVAKAEEMRTRASLAGAKATTSQVKKEQALSKEQRKKLRDLQNEAKAIEIRLAHYGMSEHALETEIWLQTKAGNISASNAEKIRRQAQALDGWAKELKDVEDIVADITNTMEDWERSIEAANNAVTDQITDYEKLIATRGMDERAVAMWEAAQLEAAGAASDKVEKLRELIQAHFDLVDAQDQSARATEHWIDAIGALGGALSSMGGSIGDLANGIDWWNIQSAVQGWQENSLTWGSGMAAALGAFSAGNAAANQYGYGSQNSQLTGTVNGAVAGAQTGNVWGAIAGAIIGGIQGGLFSGSDWSSVGSQISLEISDGIMSGFSSTSTMERERPFFGGTQEYQANNPIDLQVMERIGLNIESSMAAIQSQAEALGIDTASALLSGFQAELEIDTTGLDSDQIAAEVERALVELRADMAANVLPIVSVFRQAGETLEMTLARLAYTTPLVEQGFALIGASVDQFITEEWAESLRESFQDFLPGAPDGEHLFDPEVANHPKTIVDLYRDEAEFLQAARLKFIADFESASGGVDRVHELFSSYANTFRSSSELIEQALVESLDGVRETMDSQLAGLGTTRATFSSDFQAAIDAGLDPETLSLWFQAAEQIALMGQAEQDLARHRGEALQVASLTVDQLAHLQERMAIFSSSLETMGVSADLSEQAVLNLENAFGSLEQVLNRHQEFLEEYYSATERNALRTQEAAGVIRDYGMSVEDVMALGRDGVKALYAEIWAAVQSGEQSADQLARFYEFAEAVDHFLDDVGTGAAADVLDDVAQGVTTVTDAFGSMFNAVSYFEEQFYTAEERVRLSVQAAAANIEAAGFDIDQLVTMGREGFRELIEAAQVMGDTTALDQLLSIIRDVDTVFDSIGDSAGDAASSLASLESAVARVAGSINNSIRSILSSGTPGAGPSTALTSQIASINEMLDAGGISAQAELDLIAQLEGLIADRYENEYGHIMHVAELSQRDREARNQAELDALRAMHAKKVEKYREEQAIYERMLSLGSGLTDFRADLQVAGLGTQATFDEIMARFLAEVGAVQSGASDGSDLIGLGQQVIDLGQELYANGPQFQALVDQVMAQVDGVLGYIDGLEAPTDPGELHLPEISKSTQSTAVASAAIAAAQQRAVAELEELRRRTLEIEEEARAESEQKEQELVTWRETLLGETTTQNETLAGIDGGMAEQVVIWETIETNTAGIDDGLIDVQNRVDASAETVSAALASLDVAMTTAITSSFERFTDRFGTLFTSMTDRLVTAVGNVQVQADVTVEGDQSESGDEPPPVVIAPVPTPGQVWP